MTLFHFAYTFDGNDFGNYLMAKTSKNGKLDTTLLRDLSKSVIDNASEEQKQILTNLKYDKEWLDDPDNDASQAYLWNSIALIRVFKHCPSLSNNRFLYSSLVLEKILPSVGWRQLDIQDLVFGKSLDSFFDDLKHKAFVKGIGLYGGCLNTKRIDELLLHLEATQNLPVLNTLKTYEQITEFTQAGKLLPKEIINYAYEDAFDMLKTALKRNEALYLHRDT
jgi:hypothetical protein